MTTTEHPAILLKELQAGAALLDEGKVVCLYPEETEGNLGFMLSFRRSLELIMKGRDCPVIPLYVDNLWGGLFDEKLGRLVAKKFPHPVTISFGKPACGRMYPAEIVEEIQKLGFEIWMGRRAAARPVHHGFVHNARSKAFRKIMGDETSPKVSYLKTLIGSIALACKLNPYWKDQDYVGVLLPQCCGSVLANAAVTFSGRAVINLNFSTGYEGIVSAIKQADIKTLVTSRQFLAKMNLALPDHVTILYLEDIRKTISFERPNNSFAFGAFCSDKTYRENVRSKTENHLRGYTDSHFYQRIDGRAERRGLKPL